MKGLRKQSNMFDFSHSFFRPMWRRTFVVCLCVGWGLFEFIMGSVFWGSLFIGFAGMSFWKLFIDQENLKKLDERADN